MGSKFFLNVSSGAGATEAFCRARAKMLESGEVGGYSGTILEKSDFMLVVPTPEEVGGALSRRQHLEEWHDSMEDYGYGGNPRTDPLNVDAAILVALDADMLVNEHFGIPRDHPATSKWGPCGCIRVPESESFVFFGHASY